MQRFWVLFLWLLWFGIGCSKDVPVEGVPFFDPEGKRISLFVTSPGLKEGTFLLEKGETREVKFVPPLTLEAGSNRVRLKIAKLKGRIWIEFFGSNKRYSLELPTSLSGGGYFTFELPPSSYRGFRIRGQEGQESREVVFQEGRIGNFPLQTRFEEGRFVEIASFVIPENVDKTTVVLKLTSGTDSSPLKGVHFRLMNKGSLPSSSIRATFFGLGKERRTIFIRTRPVQEDVFVYDKWLGFTPARVQMEGLDKGIALTASVFTWINGSPERGISNRESSSVVLPPVTFLPPLPADLETILSFPQEAWRAKELEVFQWSLFPEILVFDTKDYTLQKELFHRLAFFLEKKGYRGKLHPDQKIWDLHGWNAHNYRGEGLAAFFNEAERTNFPLNPKEQWLREYLVTYGVLVRQHNKVAPGRGGILSISRESSDPHRRLLLTHEAFHGVYYASKPFQEFVASLWKGLSSDERKFWLYLLSWMQYDSSDSYLVVNEFQAYLLQQPPNMVDRYFKETMVQRVLEKNPETEGFFKEVFEKHPDMFSKPAQRLQDFLGKELGIGSTTLPTLRP